MTTTSTLPATAPDLRRRWDLVGGTAALIAAGTFVVGIALFVTSLADYTSGDPTPAESVDVLVEHQTTFFLWYLTIFLVFGAAIVPLVRALHLRLRSSSPLLADVAAVFGVIWAGLMFATGMISNIGIGVVADLAETDPAQAEAVWSSIDAVTNGLGGGNEVVGGLWVLLVSVAALRSDALPRAVAVIGLLSALAGLVTVVPGLEDVGMVFGLGLIVWFVGAGAALLRTDPWASTER